ncbi:MAG TPA: preprotein translocase subunit SecE [Mycobacterium sp.]|nr:preprotein translocase subunit SecE [Mycobacterium sp.]HQC78549.1 preprotein translocase subunit SecE [Mycobacterium sp.]
MTQPLRPTGKRSKRTGGTALAEVDVEEEALTEQFETVDAAGKKAKKAKTDGETSRNPFLFVLNYLKQVIAELRKVIWPNRKQMVSYTSVVLAFLVFMVTLIGLVDLGWAKLVLLVFG